MEFGEESLNNLETNYRYSVNIFRHFAQSPNQNAIPGSASSGPGMFLFVLQVLIRFQRLGYEHLCDAALTLSLDIKIANNREEYGTHEVDEQIHHGIQQPDVQITALADGLASAIRVDDDRIHRISRPNQLSIAHSKNSHSTPMVMEKQNAVMAM